MQWRDCYVTLISDVLIIINVMVHKMYWYIKIEINDSNQCNRFRSAKSAQLDFRIQVLEFLASDKLGLHIYFCNILDSLCNRCHCCKLMSIPIFPSALMDKILVSLYKNYSSFFTYKRVNFMINLLIYWLLYIICTFL